MATLEQERNTPGGVQTVRPPRRYSTVVKFTGQAVDIESGEIPTTVEIYADGNKWYCNVRRGAERTRPMGPYTKQQAERIQDIRRMLIAKGGTGRLVFE